MKKQTSAFLRTSFFFSTAAVFAVPVLFASACGSRTGLLVDERITDASSDRDTGPLRECTRDEDCGDITNLCDPPSCVSGLCKDGLRKIVCEDNDPCTDNTCEPLKGACVFKPVSFDLDGDGFRGPKPGKKPGESDACGNDCDDTRASAFPGNKEICDGVDNDCNGVIDDGARYVTAVGTGDGVRISSASLAKSSPGGIAHDGTKYLAGYTGTVSGKDRAFTAGLSIDGQKLSPETRLTQTESDSFGGAVVWTGDRFATTWTDRRQNNYEVFFAMLNPDGTKMAPGDVRVSISDEYSLGASLAWTGKEFVLVWQEGVGGDGTFTLWGRKIGLDGVPVGNPIQLTTVLGDDAPTVAVGRPGLGLAWSRNIGGVRRILFQPFDFDLKPLITQPVVVTDNGEAAQYPGIVWNETNFVVTWERPGSPSSIRAASLDGLGKVLVPSKLVSDSPRFARYGSVIGLGDRLLLVYADSRDQNQGFELYSRMLNADLSGKTASDRITNKIGDSIYPGAVLGPKGEIGVLFRDDREGAPQTYFTHLTCVADSITQPVDAGVPLVDAGAAPDASQSGGGNQ